MAKATYTLSDFYLFCKLGIWHSGNVEGWGLVEKIEVDADGLTNKGCFIVEKPEAYKDMAKIIGSELYAGLYLLDLRLLDIQKTNKFNNKYKIYNYLVVISECRLWGVFGEHIYYLKVTNYQPLEQFRRQLYDGIATNKRSNWSPIKPKRNVRRFDSSPLNSVTRKH